MTGPGRSAWLDKPAATDHYNDIMNRLGAAALSAARTAGLLAEMIRET